MTRPNDPTATVERTHADAFALFDRLPPIVRRALCRSIYNWDTGHVLEAIEEGIDPARVAWAVQYRDREAIRAERIAVWGPDYPVQP